MSSQPATSTDAPEARLRRLARQFLVHSFLYYRLAEPVIGDERFDALVRELEALRGEHPQVELPHARLLEQALGPEGSGYSIRDYPPDIVTDAFKVLYATSSTELSFEDFVARRGYRVEVADAGGAA